jgi:DHA1 family bicyclomycin/chloramphenicol resistance-like MFS transporter
VSSLDGLLAARVVQALGVCAASVISRAISRDLFSGEALSKTLSLTMVAMAAAPGFSPLVGSGLESSVGWRGTFLVLAACAVAIALVYGLAMGESHPADRRAAHTLAELARGYGELASAPQFLVPALAAGLVVGALNAFFAAAPAILIVVIGLSPLELGLFFAATVLIVFAAGFAAPRLVHRFGANPVVLAGLVVCTIGGFLLHLAYEMPGLGLFSTAVAVFLLGMGLVNPVGTALSLQPFGKQAGLASALLGFMQMALSSLATFVVTRLPLDPGAALGWIITSASVLALVFFALSALRPARTDQAAE